MGCENRHPDLWLLAADALEEGDALELRQHLEGCEACRAQFREATAVLERFGQGLPPVAPPPIVREQLLARAARSRGARDGRDRGRWMQLAAAALVGALLGGAVAAQLGHIWRQPQSEAMRFELGVLHEGDTFQKQRIAQLEQRIAELERSVAGPNAALVAPFASPYRGEIGPGFEKAEAWVALLESVEEHAGTEARVLCVAEEGLCEFRASGLPPTPPGENYALWLTNLVGSYYLVGTFTVDADGEATLLAEAPMALGRLARSFVTLERGEAGWRPHGSVVLVAGGRNLAGMH